MIKRTIEISTHGSTVFEENSQLIVEKDGELIGTAPIEDIGVLIFDSAYLTVSSGLLAALAENNSAVIFTNEKHLPVLSSLPFDSHTVQSKTLREQVRISKPTKKKLWSDIVAAKILNQAKLLDSLGANCADLIEISKRVPSGDPKNLEAYAARIYWRRLFGNDFRRRRDAKDVNIFLNYGYAIIRACITRAIVGTGLHPAFGVHHSSQYNPFPLADDLVEPIRPFIDQCVWHIAEANEEGSDFEITKEIRTQILEVLPLDCTFNKKTLPLFSAITRYVSSVKSVMLGNEKSPNFPLL